MSSYLDPQGFYSGPQNYLAGLGSYGAAPSMSLGGGMDQGFMGYDTPNPQFTGSNSVAGMTNFAPGTPTATAPTPGIMDSFLTKTNANGITTQGWGGPAIGVAQGLFNAFMGMKQYGLYKDQLAEGKREFGLNYDAQRTTTNSQLADRQRARYASNPGAYQSVSDYMAQNGIKG